MGQGGAAAQGFDHRRGGRQALLGVGVHGRGRPLGVTLQRLVGALGHRQVGNRVQHVEQVGHFGGDRSRLVRCRRREFGVQAERVAVRDVAAADVPGQGQAVDHVTGLDLLDAHLAGIGSSVGDAPGAQRELPAQRADKTVHFGLVVPVVQAAFEPVAQQRAERLTLAQAIQDGTYHPDPGRAEVHRESAGVVWGAVSQVAGAQHCGGPGLGRGRRVHVTTVSRVVQQRGRAGEHRGQRAGQLHGRQLARFRPDVLQPAVGADVHAAGGWGPAVRAESELGEAFVGQAQPPGVQPVGGQVEVFGEDAFQPGGRQVGEQGQSSHLFGQRRGGRLLAEDAGDVFDQQAVGVAGDGGGGRVQHRRNRLSLGSAWPAPGIFTCTNGGSAAASSSGSARLAAMASSRPWPSRAARRAAATGRAGRPGGRRR